MLMMMMMMMIMIMMMMAARRVRLWMMWKNSSRTHCSNRCDLSSNDHFDPYCHIPDQTESENKYELLAQKLKVKEGEAQRSTEKADGIECKFIEIEDELKVGSTKENWEEQEAVSAT